MAWERMGARWLGLHPSTLLGCDVTTEACVKRHWNDGECKGQPFQCPNGLSVIRALGVSNVWL